MSIAYNDCLPFGYVGVGCRFAEYQIMDISHDFASSESSQVTLYQNQVYLINGLKLFDHESGLNIWYIHKNVQ